MPAQLDEIKKVRNGAQPVPEALRRSGPVHDLAGCARYIDIGARRIVERKSIERTIPNQLANGPLVEFDTLAGQHLGRPANDTRRRLPGDRMRLFCIDAHSRAMRKIE